MNIAGDALAINRPTQARPNAAQGRLKHLHPMDAEGDLQLLAANRCPRPIRPPTPAAATGQRSTDAPRGSVPDCTRKDLNGTVGPVQDRVHDNAQHGPSPHANSKIGQSCSRECSTARAALASGGAT